MLFLVLFGCAVKVTDESTAEAFVRKLLGNQDEPIREVSFKEYRDRLCERDSFFCQIPIGQLRKTIRFYGKSTKSFKFYKARDSWQKCSCTALDDTAYQCTTPDQQDTIQLNLNNLGDIVDIRHAAFEETLKELLGKYKKLVR
jgi:hypothetical protein